MGGKQLRSKFAPPNHVAGASEFGGHLVLMNRRARADAIPAEELGPIATKVGKFGGRAPAATLTREQRFENSAESGRGGLGKRESIAADVAGVAQ